jgi:phosphatidylglycerol:prolipoprotein diacylglycerol transferase
MWIAPSIDPIAFYIGSFPVRWYGLSYMLGIFLAYYYAIYLIKRYPFRIHQETISNYISWFVISILMGGRLGHIFFYDWDFYKKNPSSILKLWKGGMSFHGALIGVGLGTFFYAIYCAHQESKDEENNHPFWSKVGDFFWSFADLLAVIAPIGLGLGRIANFINQELYGIPTKKSWGVVFPFVDGISRHPTQLYEAFGEGIFLLLLQYWLLNFIFSRSSLVKNSNFLEKKSIFFGQLVASFLFFYGCGRFFIEFFKEQDSFWEIYPNFWMPTTQLLCIIMMIFGILIFGYRISCLKFFFSRFCKK